MKPQPPPEVIEAARELRERRSCQRSLLDYAARMHGGGYIRGAWLARVAARLEAFVEAAEAGKRPRLALHVPPQHGKSALVSRALPAWILGTRPDWPIILASYASSLAAGHGRWIRNALADPLHRTVFPNCELSGDSSAADLMQTTAGGQVRAIGVRGGISGVPARILIIDDPHAGRAEAESETIREDTLQWYHGEAARRLAPGGGIILCMTRWSVRDLSASIIDAPGADQWEVISLPAVDADGNALFPERYSPDELDRIRRSMPKSDWLAMYQQTPREMTDSSYITSAMVKYGDTTPPPGAEVGIAVDCAISLKTTADYFVCVAGWRRDDGALMVCDLARKRAPFTEQIEIVRAMSRRNRAHMVGIEGAAGGKQLIEMLKRDGTVAWIKELTPVSDKVTRAARLIADFEQGHVLLDETFRPHAGELTAFPAGEHDDVVDGLAWLAGLPLEPCKPGAIARPPAPVFYGTPDEMAFLDPWDPGERDGTMIARMVNKAMGFTV